MMLAARLGPMLLAVLCAAACAAGGVEEPSGAVATGTEETIPFDDAQQPPLIATISGQSFNVTSGSNCWLIPRMGSCSDYFATMTQVLPFVVPAGAAIDISGDLPWERLDPLTVNVGPAVPAQSPSNDPATLSAWAGPDHPVPHDASPARLRFTAPIEAGVYVVAVEIEVHEVDRPAGWGQASYALLIEVTP